ncbi:MAG: NAD(P)H-dependent glycerol-3-phosphate dehydrogenase [Pantoea sp. Brub]|nr:NAD(P)H-dependent glycerol-3-phosphate dehydrogenase [Pantoea sp. Brub]
MKIKSSISIIGAGSYGTALAITLARNGSFVLLWGHNSNYLAKMQYERCNFNYLPGIHFPDNLFIESNLSKVIKSNRDILIAVPSNVFSDVLKQIKPHLRTDSRIILGTKGLEKNTGRLLQYVVHEILGITIPLAVISGPSFAIELAKGLPTVVSLAATNTEFAKELKHKLHCDKTFIVCINSDLIGLQLGGALKNIIAIAVGISDGIGFGANARTALITRGLNEIIKLGTALGARSTTFMDIAGLGDLLLTCTDNKSRNRRFGIMLGKGNNINYAKKNIGQVVEGYEIIKEARILSIRTSINMPIIQEVHNVLYCAKSVQEAATSLLTCQTCKTKIISK